MIYQYKNFFNRIVTKDRFRVTKNLFLLKITQNQVVFYV